MTTILVAGFGPFPGAPGNPSAALARALIRRRRPALAGVKLVGATIPTAYTALTSELPALLRRHDPDGVLLFGLATRARAVRIEQRAVNAASLVHPDAERRKLSGRRVFDDAPAELRVRAPVQRLRAAVRSTGVSARLSRDAGRYLCNATLFATLDAVRRSRRSRRVAFIHIPPPRRRGRAERSNAALPAMSDLVRAGEAALIALLADLRQG